MSSLAVLDSSAETQSSNPFTKPAVNVNYFSVDWDLDVQIAGARLARKVLASPPIRYACGPCGLVSNTYVKTSCRIPSSPRILVLYMSRTSLTFLSHSNLRSSKGETVPGHAKVPDNGDGGSDADWKKWIVQSGSSAGFSAVSHPIGTAAMMRRSLGGVVDAQLKVYDTANVRVVDASVMPIQVSAHLSSTLYGIAEKAADLIKAAQ